MKARLLFGVLGLGLLAVAGAQTFLPQPSQEASRRARLLLRETREEAVRIRVPSERSRILTQLVGLYALLDDSSQAREALQLLEAGHDRNLGWCNLALTLGGKRGAQKGLAAVAEIQDVEDRERCREQLAQGQIDGPDHRDLVATLKTISPVTNLSVRASLLSRLAVVFAKEGNATNASHFFRSAIATAEMIQDTDDYPVWRTWKLLDIAVAQADAGRRRESWQMLRTMRLEIDRMKNLRARGDSLFKLAKSQAQAGDLVEALATVNSMDNQVSKDNALADLADVQLAKGDIQGAFSMLAAIQPGRDTVLVSVKESIAEEQAKQGDIAGALKTADTIGHIPYKEIASFQIAGFQGALGDNEGALQTALKINDADYRVRALIGAGYTVGPSGEPRCEGAVFRQALETAITQHENNSIHEIAWKMAECGEIDTAHRAVEAIPEGDYSKAPAVESVTYSQARRGAVNEALLWARQQKSASSRASGLLGVAEALLGDGPPPARFYSN